jgi:hypothetical protein
MIGWIVAEAEDAPLKMSATVNKATRTKRLMVTPLSERDTETHPEMRPFYISRLSLRITNFRTLGRHDTPRPGPASCSQLLALATGSERLNDDRVRDSERSEGNRSGDAAAQPILDSKDDQAPRQAEKDDCPKKHTAADAGVLSGPDQDCSKYRDYQDSDGVNDKADTEPTLD